MSKDPAILFYTGDFLNGCSCLTMEERGQYITLLCLQHQLGHLPEKTIRLSLGSVSVDVLKKFLQDEEGNFFNERMDAEMAKRAQFIETRKDNGKKGGRPKKANGKPNAKANAKANEKLIENINKDEDLIQLKKVFEIFRTNYPGTKRGFEIEFLNLVNKHKDWKEIVPILSDKLQYQKNCRNEKRLSGGFIPEWRNLQTWINQRCWEEEIATNNKSNGHNGKSVGPSDEEVAGIIAEEFGSDSKRN